MFKHAVLHAALVEQARANRTCLYVETHAARGVYDLTSKQATKTGEAKDGVIALLDDTPKVLRPLKPWIDLVRNRGTGSYPGSPALAQATLDPKSARLVLFEMHKTEHAELVTRVGGPSNTLIHQGDGYSGALKLAPRRGEDMFVFLDPSYETERDMDALANWLPRALRRWPNAHILVWLPLFQDSREVDFGAHVASLSSGFVAGVRWPEDSESGSALEGSAVIGLNFDDEMGKKALAIANALEIYWERQAT